MRWKWLLLLSLISISFVLVKSNDESGDKVENVNNYDEDYDEGSDAKVVEEEAETVKVEEQETLPSTDENPPGDNEDSEPKVNPEDEDTVDVEPISAQSGKLMNYDDYMTFNLEGENDGQYDWNNMNNRVQPDEPPSHRNDGRGYTITPERLRFIRSHFLYWFFDKGGPENSGDLQRDIHASNQQVHKNFNWQLPFFGFRFNYTRVSMNGYLEFSDPPEHYTYPLVFPIKDWPRRNDPSFIGIFFSRCRIGRIYQTDWDQRAPGVYFRQERDLMTRTDRFGVEVRERVMWDIREGVVGSDTFVPKHVVFVTWKNMSFAGGIDNSLFKTNSFQLVLASDEVYTYAIMNYAEINWSSHTEAGGDTTGGEGGVPAYIGFNAGNGTQAYEYRPYSQASVLRDLTGRGWANGFPGRHIFRIDERIMLGTCNKDIDAAHLPLVFAPESGNMLGGAIINITGPCFLPEERIECLFETEPNPVIGHYVDRNRAICIQPPLFVQGYIRFAIRVGTEPFKWRGWYFVETPATATDRIFFQNSAQSNFSSIHLRNPSEIAISWNRMNLTSNFNAQLRINLYGYRERTFKPELHLITTLVEGIQNSGFYTIVPDEYRRRSNPNMTDIQFGFLQITLQNPEDFNGLRISPVLWSKPIPLAWYFDQQWSDIHGRNWPRALCDNWLRADRFLRNFAHEIPVCPCKLDQALYDKGRYMPDFDCDRDANPVCLNHRGAIHCVRSGNPSNQGSEQQCCYNANGFLMLSHDQMWGSRPRRAHNVGRHPYNEAVKVPTLSQWFHDMRPYYSCCRWQDEQAVGCETFRFERRPSQDCVAYQAPGVASIFGDPHLVTFDGLEYTFNGMGEFVLVRAKDGTNEIDVQGRFEQVARNIHGPVMATHPTSIAVRGHNSTVIEVRLRPRDAQWRYRLDVFADGRRIYFDRHSLKFQFFFGVTVYTPTYILNQSEVVIMFPSGAGVEVVENAGFMTARVYLPWAFINKTRGLLGNWSFEKDDDFTRPDGTVLRGVNLNNFATVHREFAMHWMLSDRETEGVGAGLFTREFGRTASYYANASFVPNFIREPRDFLGPNRTQDIEMAHDLCGESYQCRFDFGMTLNREMAHFTRNYYDSAVNIRKNNEVRVLSCGILETPRFGYKLSFEFTPGSVIVFQCNEGFYLQGDRRRICGEDGRWDVPEYGYTECLREVFFVRNIVWIVILIIVFVIMPMILCIVCVVYQYRKKQLRKDPNYVLPIPHSRSGSRTTLKGMSDMSDNGDDGSIKKVRNYDATYNTHEPLENKPNSDFDPSKKMDLDEDDITSSEGSGVTDQRQMGRRSQRLASDYKPIEEEDSQYPPAPVESPQPYLNGTYSPTFSNLDRSSYASDPTRSPIQNNPGPIRVLPMSQPPQQPQAQQQRFFGGPSVSPPPPTQTVGLPRVEDSRSTAV